MPRAKATSPNRRAARRAAFEVIYGARLRGVDPTVVLSERDSDLYTQEIVEALGKLGDQVDEVILRCSHNWKPERIGVVEQSVLRVAIAEILGGLVPYPVAINEAVVIAKKFGGDHAGSFVNGVLSGLKPDPVAEPNPASS